MHDATHEARLEAMLVGDLDPQAPSARAALESCAECRHAWAQMRRVLRGLDELALPEQQVLSEAGELRHAPGEREAEAALRGAIEHGAATRGRPGWPLLLSAAGLLLAAAALLLMWRSEHAPAPPDPYLGDGASLALEPVGEHEPLFPVRWKHVFAPDEQAWLRVETRDVESEPWRELYDGSFTGSWTPDEAQRSRCGKRIRYRVTVAKEAERRPPSGWVEAFSR